MPDQTGSPDSLSGKRVLLAEDTPILAREMEWKLQDLGCDVVGPYAKLERVVDAAREANFDVALFDVNLRGEFVYPAVTVCLDRGIPVVLSTGYDADRTPEEFATLPRLIKPINPEDVGRTLAAALKERPSGRPEAV